MRAGRRDYGINFAPAICKTLGLRDAPVIAECESLRAQLGGRDDLVHCREVEAQVLIRQREAGIAWIMQFVLLLDPVVFPRDCPHDLLVIRSPGMDIVATCVIVPFQNNRTAKLIHYLVRGVLVISGFLNFQIISVTVVDALFRVIEEHAGYPTTIWQRECPRIVIIAQTIWRGGMLHL